MLFILLPRLGSAASCSTLISTTSIPAATIRIIVSAPPLQGNVLAGEVSRGRRLRRTPPLRCACLPHRGHQRSKGLRPRLHADLRDPQGKSPAVERGSRNPVDRQGLDGRQRKGAWHVLPRRRPKTACHQL